MALTPKQEKFCQCIVSGMSGKDSYIAAYDTKAGDNTIYTEVTRLLDREDVQKRLDALRKPLEHAAQAKALSEREKKKAIIWEELENARSQQDHAAVARYMDILNKMDSEYINIQRIDHEQSSVDNMDTETLLRLVK